MPDCFIIRLNVSRKKKMKESSINYEILTKVDDHLITKSRTGGRFNDILENQSGKVTQLKKMVST